MSTPTASDYISLIAKVKETLPSAKTLYDGPAELPDGTTGYFKWRITNEEKTLLAELFGIKALPFDGMILDLSLEDMEALPRPVLLADQIMAALKANAHSAGFLTKALAAGKVSTGGTRFELDIDGQKPPTGCGWPPGFGWTY